MDRNGRSCLRPAIAETKPRIMYLAQIIQALSKLDMSKCHCHLLVAGCHDHPHLPPCFERKVSVSEKWYPGRKNRTHRERPLWPEWHRCTWATSAAVAETGTPDDSLPWRTTWADQTADYVDRHHRRSQRHQHHRLPPDQQHVTQSSNETPATRHEQRGLSVTIRMYSEFSTETARNLTRLQLLRVFIKPRRLTQKSKKMVVKVETHLLLTVFTTKSMSHILSPE